MRKKTVIALLLVFAIVLTGMLFACNEVCTEHVDENGDLKCDKCEADLTPSSGDNGGANNGGTNNGGTNNGKATYTINVKSMAGTALGDVTAYISDSATGDLKAYMTTNANGTASKEIDVGNYYIELGTLPTGYAAEEKYYFNANRVANIVLETKVVEGEHKNYTLGSVMKDFSVELVNDGGTFKLSEALEEYDAVLLNFFYTSCSPCISEFPYLNEAAGMYSEDIAVICVDTYGDTFTQVESFYNNSNGYFDGPLSNLNMGIHSIDLFSAFNSAGYPTSVMIDRYGVICLIEVGGLPYLYPFTAMFDYFSGDDYTQKLFTSIDELTPMEKPAELGYSQPDSSVVAPIMNGSNMASDVVYYPESEAEDSEYYWPFVVGEKDGRECMVTSNYNSVLKYNTISAMHVDVTLQAGQALSLDYYCSTESGADYFYVMVDGESIYTISGVGKEWEKCYPYVATKDGTYKISFIYYKDSDTDLGEDRVYIDNLNVVASSSIDKASYIPRNAVSEPTEYNDGYLNYATVVFNQEDGYYHVGTENGPLLLANLMNYVIDDESDEATSLYLYAYANGIKIDGVEMYSKFVNYCSYASNSEIGGYCTVNEELKTYLVALNKLYTGGVLDASENGWLRFCKYYDVYGTAVQLADPIAGLAPFSAYEAVVNASVGLEEYPNSVTYKTIIMPRGKLFSFTSEEGGVYRILTTGEAEVDGWIFDEEGFYSKNVLLIADHIERLTDTNNDGTYTQIEYGSANVCMTYYFEAGKEYFIDIAYYDTTATGTINFKIERLGDTYTQFRYASPAPFTFYVDPETGEVPVDNNGNEIYETVAGGVTPVYNEEDGYYYVGSSKLYVDITLPVITGFFSDSVQSALDKDYFDFTMVPVYADDGTVSFVKGVDDDGVSLKNSDGTDMILAVKDAEGNVTAIRDYTADMQAYIDNNMIVSDGVYGSEATLAAGCVAVDKDMAVMLQYLVDKTSFRGIKNSWTKLCYYFEYLGPQSSEQEA